ncbi:putative transporter YycB [Arenibacter antarcticus]|uniref:CynX/NimT family MFS transporter n=1 Tax=Arenibacter antarcticus TaxID=2040469 RepID=A0ABW5VE99_9FLAO|nr:MFS transporter [Arenibacter sp. H213]MCM4166538.1 MFS transporter [Arenibacter sp. H213]
MPEKRPTIKKGKFSANDILLIAGILFIAINLRPALASVGPLINHIRVATGLSSSMLGLLTTLPLIAFGVVSSLTPLFTRRFGIAYTLFGALLLMTIGIGIRSLQGILPLYLGTLMFGIAIAFGNVLLPSLTKRNFSSNSGFVTSLYSSVMAIGASLAAGISVPLADGTDLGWRGSLAVWSILALIGLLLWIPQLSRMGISDQKRSYRAAMKALGKAPKAWKIAFFMGLQSFTFYVILAWLPAIVQSRGYDADYAGWMLSLSQATGILGSIIIPQWAGKKRDQRNIVVILMLVESIGVLGLLLPSLGFIALWVSLIGFVLGGTFGLALLFIVLRSKDADTATELSGMAQSIGYLVAATGPIIFGSLFDFTRGWTYSLILLFVVIIFKMYMGIGAGKPGKL